MGFGKCLNLILLAIQFIAVGAALGISGYLFSQVKDASNVVAILPLVFTAFALFSTIVGIISTLRRSKCGFVVYTVLSLICIAGFAGICAMSGLWLAGKDILPESIKELVATESGDINSQDLSSICAEFNSTDVDFNNIDNEVFENDFQEAIDKIESNFNLTVENLKQLLGYCQFEQLVFDLLRGRDDDSNSQTVDIIMGIAVGSGILAVDYLLTIFGGCCLVCGKSSDNFS